MPNPYITTIQEGIRLFAKDMPNAFLRYSTSLLEKQLAEIEGKKYNDTGRRVTKTGRIKLSFQKYEAVNAALESIASPIRECLGWARKQIK